MSLLINGKAYDWADISIDYPGFTMQPQEINYDDELEKELAYGIGSAPRGWGTGNYKASAKLTVLRDDFEALLAHCKTQGIALYKLVIPKIVVSYANDGDKITTDVLSKVTITKTSHKAASGDKSLKVDLDLLPVGVIVRNGVSAI